MSKGKSKGRPPSESYFTLDSADTNPARLKQEREKARKLKKSQWWLDRLNRGICHYCELRFPPNRLTMDHVVPLARGGLSVMSNLVPACEACNQSKKLEIPVERVLRELAESRADSELEGEPGASTNNQDTEDQ